MAKVKFEDPLTGKSAGGPAWQRSPAEFLAGRAAIDPVDALAVEMERKWGCGRLRLIVTEPLRLAFDRQRVKFNNAVWLLALSDVIEQAQRMGNAWRALDAAATQAGAAEVEPMAWEVCLDDGSIAAIVPDGASGYAYLHAAGRKVAVFTLAEIGKLLSCYPLIAKAKEQFPGATVVGWNEPTDPTEAIENAWPLDDDLPF